MVVCAACDCWDAEILMSSGWIECVGIADRSAYDLKVHSKATKIDLIARETYPEPREEELVVIKLNSGLLGRTFKGDNAAVLEALNAVRRKTVARWSVHVGMVFLCLLVHECRW